MKVKALASITLLAICLLSGCAQSGNVKIPSLAGHYPNTGALPPPDDYQANSAINASTMVAPNQP